VLNAAPVQGARVGDGVGQSAAVPPKTLQSTGSVGSGSGGVAVGTCDDTVGVAGVASPSPLEPQPPASRIRDSAIATGPHPRREKAIMQPGGRQHASCHGEAEVADGELLDARLARLATPVALWALQVRTPQSTPAALKQPCHPSPRNSAWSQ
jgi:hypothetical protein